ncbi:hypothetical protein VNO77_03365 [Canavalia gladiata]|uniref:Uncharacterized protein n=1 Tax=Canavalia gladiata TaxID=3824 RepID=A0AAN9MUL1_CANGL
MGVAHAEFVELQGLDARRPHPPSLARAYGNAQGILKSFQGEVWCSSSETGDEFVRFLGLTYLPLGSHVPLEANREDFHIENTVAQASTSSTRAGISMESLAGGEPEELSWMA